jgi:AraC family transcriptional activator of pobA
MPAKEPQRIKSISEFHRVKGLPKPENPLISVVNFDDLKAFARRDELHLVYEFYSIALKKDFEGKIRYGQQQYDFDEGVMIFMAPGQTLRIELPNDRPAQHSGWLLLFHPDFLWRTALAAGIKQYHFFDYAVNEALFLSENEELTITDILLHIQQEYRKNIDRLSQKILVAQLDLLLSYAERFYQRQFITRKVSSHQILNRLENLLNRYFDSEDITLKGLPTVRFIADGLHTSPDYLSGLLKELTGLNTQQHIHQRLIEKAKEKLSATNLSVGEIAYQLGFEHPPSFSKLFKAKTSQSPLQFRQSFN